MPRRITAGTVGRQVLGDIVTENNSLQSIVQNANLVLEPNGTGIVVSESDVLINGNNALRLSDADTNYVALKAPAGLSSNYTLTLPTDDGGTNQTLVTNGSGVLSWSTTSITITESASDNNAWFPTFISPAQRTAGSNAVSYISSGKFEFNPSSGTLTTTALVETSSIALKENISPIQNGLDSILKLAGVTYDRKDGSSKNEAGLIAEEVYQILPNVVSTDKNGNPYGINYTKLSAYLIEAVKSLSTEIQQLKQAK